MAANRKEADNLHSVVPYLYQEKYDVTAIVGHSNGGSVVVLFASIYGNVPLVVLLVNFEPNCDMCPGENFVRDNRKKRRWKNPK
ncbi:unnamed protein product [Urochloa humidicola]